MDYSKLSDQEINKLVAFALGCKEVVPDIFMDDVRRYEFDKPKNKSGRKFYFDPCNNQADAWPIIVGNGISLIKCTVGSGYWSAEIITDIDEVTDKLFQCQSSFDSQDANPLRAAMIVFLMMQESANVPVNPTRPDLR